MGWSSWPLSQVALTLGSGPWVVSTVSSPTPPTPGGAGSTFNLRPGWLVRTTRAFASVNGTPYRSNVDQPPLNTPGFYTVDVADDALGNGRSRYLICIVDLPNLDVGMRAPHSDEPETFQIMATTLAAAYPHGKVAASSVAMDFVAEMAVSSAVALEVRKKEIDGSYVKIGEALATVPGVVRSYPFALSVDVADLKLAIVFAPQDLVLS